jgi:alpha-tubulin suppressor-like RCC1 family protein
MSSTHYIAIKSTGASWSWGMNTYGQLGDQTIVSKSSPVLVVGAHSFISVFVGATQGTTPGDDHSLALKRDGTTWCWGNNSNGQLGDQTVTSKSSPILVVGSHSFTQLAGSLYTSYGLKCNGQVWAWGDNTSGQLGDQSTTAKSSPVLVVGNIYFRQISSSRAAGTGSVVSAHTLDNNQNAWGWGDNAYGQLGNQSRTASSSPVLVVGNHKFIDVSSGGRHVMGLKGNGEVWCWGDGTSGVLGDNTATSKSSPVLVVGSHSFIKILSELTSCFALKANGEIWAWGYNGAGGLGDNSTTTRSSPVLVVGAHSFIYIACARQGGAGLKADGQVWTWGLNTNGQLGDQTTTNKSSPVLVVGSHSFIALHNQSAYYTEETDHMFGRGICQGFNCGFDKA